MKKNNINRRKRLSKDELIELFVNAANKVLEGGKLDILKHQNHHNGITCFEHCLAVAFVSLKIANFLGLKYDVESLIKGALLHDYFLYDYHDNPEHRFHGFTHAKTALNNALRDFEINEKEADIIRKHMFPLNITPPRYKESLYVCIADKICATGELVLKRCKTSKLFNY